MPIGNFSFCFEGFFPGENRGADLLVRRVIFTGKFRKNHREFRVVFDPISGNVAECRNAENHVFRGKSEVVKPVVV